GVDICWSSEAREGFFDAVFTRNAQNRSVWPIIDRGGSTSYPPPLSQYVSAPRQQHNATLLSSELSRFLKNKLPPYMIPTQFVLINEIPKTPNGKIDRKALPASLLLERPDLEEAYIGPHTDMEKAIAVVWEDILGVRRIGIHDNFFELGGHSLLAVKLIIRLKEACGIDIPLQIVFDMLTIEKLAQYVETSIFLNGAPAEAAPGASKDFEDIEI
ncbi:MAG: phosphopantetheine-binding protein, partial [Pseudomonadota bacterium]